LPDLTVQDLTKRYGRIVAIDHINFTVRDGELLSLLGPSGCGKTTTLRIIAGLTRQDEGRVFLGSQDITDLPPEKRGMGMVFQNYALWPHMTVFDNVAFPLRARGMPENEVRRRVKETLELVKLYELRDRYPHQLSGGQQQRVALARALAVQPRILLLDEPLSNLDAKLREEMRFELKELQRKLRITAVYVTHDQAEALALSDKIAVMNAGKIMQLGTPKEIYEEPANIFVADFIGKINFLEGYLEEVLEDDYVLVRVGSFYIKAYTKRIKDKGPVVVGVRPSHIKLAEEKPENIDEHTNLLEGVIIHETYLGETYDYRVRVAENLVLRVQGEKAISTGSRIFILFPAEKALVIERK
jgi:iron(III) transport system ATP-binding protein